MAFKLPKRLKDFCIVVRTTWGEETYYIVRGVVDLNEALKKMEDYFGQRKVGNFSRERDWMKRKEDVTHYLWSSDELADEINVVHTHDDGD